MVARDAGVIVEWNEITERTLVENAQPIFQSLLYYGFTALAMYDAVVTIEGGYEPWTRLPRAHAHASPEVAAATAAYIVLRHYFPNSAAALTADYRSALAEVRNGVGKVHGIVVGVHAAVALIARHPDAGIDAPVPQPQQEPFDRRRVAPDPASAVADGGRMARLRRPARAGLPRDPAAPALRRWTAPSTPPTSPKSATTAGRPAVVCAPPTRPPPHCSTPSPPASNTSTRSATRSPAATSTSSTPPAPSPCSTPASPTPPSPAGATKYDHNFWRPVTAIALADTDNNPATDIVTGWTPLRPTPPYPDYPSGHACFIGSVSGSLDNLFGPGPLERPYTMKSYVDGVPDRSYITTDVLDTETMNARIWNGFHFRTAMTDGNALGHAVADTVANTFQPID